MVNSITLFDLAHTSKDNLFVEVNTISMKLGYIVEASCCSNAVLEYFKSQQADVNSTFYKSWEDVTSKTRGELLMDQLQHYASTYGTNYEGEAYIPNDGEHPYFEYEKYKVIKAATEAEIAHRCLELGQSGINLSKEVVDYLSEIICHYYDDYNRGQKYELLETLHSIELEVALCNMWDLPPIGKFQLIRYINLKVTGNAMIIQNDENFRLIKAYAHKFDFTQLTGKQLIGLASIFLRYKNFFLAFKAYKKNAPVINKLRRMAVKYHKPMTPGFWENILNNKPSMAEVMKHLEETTVFKRILLIQAIRERRFQPSVRGFLVRNQKLWLKNEVPCFDKYYDMLEAVLLSSIKKSVKVKVSDKFRLALPTSEKNFVGNYPLGTQYHFKDKDSVIGIYWRGEWGTQDFDIAYTDINGHKVGWNADYNTGDMIYSGDMTCANPEATEYLRFTENVSDGIVNVNRYNGNEGSRFDLLLGQDDSIMSGMCRSGYNGQHAYIMDPTKIDMRVECKSTSRQSMVAYVHNGVLTLMDMRTGNQSVSGRNQESVISYLNTKAHSFVFLDEIVDIVPEDYKGYEDENGELVEDFIDLREPNKDSIIKILSE